MKSVLGAVLMLTISSNAEAQVNPDSVKWRNDCRLASQIVTHGQPANRREWAIRVLPDCGAEGGRAVAAALNLHRSGGGKAEELEELVMITSVLHDANVFRAALSIAVDPAAQERARVQAFRILYFQLTRGAVDPYESFLAASGTIHFRITDYPFTEGQPLPPTAARQVLDAARTVRGDTNNRANVRAAAGRARARACRVLANVC